MGAQNCCAKPKTMENPMPKSRIKRKKNDLIEELQVMD